MRTTDGLTLVYMDSSVVSRPLTEAGTAIVEITPVVVAVELDVEVTLVGEVEVVLVHAINVSIIIKIGVIQNPFFI